MAKKKSWFDIVKRFFIRETNSKPAKARKALRALRGIVKLQAIIRGRAVRRQAITTLKCLQSIVNIQSQASTRRFGTVRQCSLGDHNTLSSSLVPTYMAATESAKAKARSMSSPKTKLGNFDTCCESYSPYKNKLSLIFSITTEVPSGGRIGKTNGYQQRSPNLKGLPGPIKSKQMVEDLSFNSECSLQIWDGHGGFR
ncbi:protein iq-domain 14 [Quercus suber]|uniref:Protein iq-domain 14 n=1 Tax=Quercus suber TaxID=58331 RepID=A0AAW0M0Z3_QUESU